MIEKIKIARLPDGTLAYARFDTLNKTEGKDFGCRVKHYIYKDEETGAYWHERVYLTHYALRPRKTFKMIVSKRKFWGKVRLVRYRDVSLPETWIAIAQCVEILEKKI